MKLEERDVIFLINFFRAYSYKLGQSNELLAAEDLHKRLLEHLNSVKKED